ncbi:MAG: PepSY-like domain-containing protein [Bacteroidetes bacterium]|nr:PepSY-like domain-containing protein [Bacteroidota bacterium]
MKTSLAVIIFAFSQLLFAQKTIPNAALKAFAEKFPNSSEVKWEKEGNEFEASFTINNVKMSANFSSEGAWSETETTISATELPEAVGKAFKEKFPKHEVTAAAKIETPKGITYEIEYKSGKKTKEIVFDANGKTVK